MRSLKASGLLHMSGIAASLLNTGQQWLVVPWKVKTNTCLMYSLIPHFNSSSKIVMQQGFSEWMGPIASSDSWRTGELWFSRGEGICWRYCFKVGANELRRLQSKRCYVWEVWCGGLWKIWWKRWIQTPGTVLVVTSKNIPLSCQSWWVSMKYQVWSTCSLINGSGHFYTMILVYDDACICSKQLIIAHLVLVQAHGHLLQTGFGWSNGVVLSFLEEFGWPRDKEIVCSWCRRIHRRSIMQPNQCAYFAIMHDGLEKVVVFYIENWTDAFNPVLHGRCMKLRSWELGFQDMSIWCEVAF